MKNCYNCVDNKEIIQLFINETLDKSNYCNVCCGNIVKEMPKIKKTF